MQVGRITDFIPSESLQDDYILVHRMLLLYGVGILLYIYYNTRALSQWVLDDLAP